MGWIFQAIGLIAGVSNICWGVMVWGIANDVDALGSWAAWLGAVAVVPTWTWIVLAVVLCFPEGRPATKREAILLRAAAAIAFVVATTIAVSPGQLVGFLGYGRENGFVTSSEPTGDPVPRRRLMRLVPVIAGVAIGGLIGGLVAVPPLPQASVEPARPSTTIASPTALPSSRPFRAWPMAESPITAYLAATSTGDSKAALDVWIGWPVETFSNTRRVTRTDELAGLRVGPGYTVKHVGYQASSTAVEREIDATFAEMLVEVTSPGGVQYQLLFMVARETPELRATLGVAGGQWMLYDVIHFHECTEMGC